MAEYTTNEYKNRKRRHSRSLIREGMFISDYIQTKYYNIYQEAAELYNSINRTNPRKPDLRRTIEYRQWKNNMSADLSMPVTPIPRQKNRQYVHVIHRDIPIPLAVHPSSSLTVLPTVESPRADNQTSPQPAESPRADNQTSPQPPESPRADNQTSPQPAESPRADNQTSPQPPESPRADNQTSPQPSETPLTNIQTSRKIMQLKIPLIPSPNMSNSIQHPQKIMETTYTETVLDEGNQTEILYPSLLDEVSPETIDKIIADLRQDPELKDIMVNIENEMNVEEEILGLNIDIPDIDDPLEEELQNIFW